MNVATGAGMGSKEAGNGGAGTGKVWTREVGFGWEIAGWEGVGGVAVYSAG
jgi:hypothetical protein